MIESSVAYLVRVEFPVGANVKKTASGVVRARAKGIAVGEELDGVDIRLVTRKCLHRLPGADIPQLRKRVAGARDEDVLIGRVDADGHDITQVVGELRHLRPSLNIP